MTHGLSGVDALLREQGCSRVHVDPHGFARKTPPTDSHEPKSG